MINIEIREERIRSYFDGWVYKNDATFPKIFAERAVYTDSHGAQYRGLSQIRRMFADRQQHGGVTKWELKGYVHVDAETFVKWYYEDAYDGVSSAFDGVSIAEFDGEGKISRLREFRAEAAHTFPYGRDFA